jgi:hypothetical protein
MKQKNKRLTVPYRTLPWLTVAYRKELEPGIFGGDEWLHSYIDSWLLYLDRHEKGEVTVYLLFSFY